LIDCTRFHQLTPVIYRVGDWVVQRIYRVVQIKLHHSHHFTILLVTNERIYKILSLLTHINYKKQQTRC